MYLSARYKWKARSIIQDNSFIQQTHTRVYIQWYLSISDRLSARLRADEELIRIMTKAVNELGLEWSPLRSHLAAGWTSVFSWGAIKPPTKARTPPKFIQAHDIVASPPTCLASVIQLQFLSHLLTALMKKDKRTCLLWMSLWPHISARPQLSDRRRGRVIHPSRAELHLHSLDAPTRRVDKLLQRCTLWLCSRSSNPRCSPVRKPVWMQLHSGTWGAWQTWLYAPPSRCPSHRAFDVETRRSKSEISKRNVLGYYRNLCSLRYGNESALETRCSTRSHISGNQGYDSDRVRSFD